MSGRSLKRLSFALRAVSVVLLAIWLVSFFHITRVRYPWRGADWELISRGGAVWIDNEPQRLREVSISADAEFPTRALWETEHDRLRADTEKAPYGPAYVASRERILAWEKLHGARWPLEGAVPTSRPASYRVQLIWILLAALACMIGLRRVVKPRGNRAVRSAIRFATVAACIAIAVLWAKSYRSPIFVPFFTQGSTYSATAFRGKVIFCAPVKTDPAKLDAMMALVSRARNDDVRWFVTPPRTLVVVNRTQMTPIGISAPFRDGAPLARIDESPDQAEASVAMLEALNDPDRYLAAYAALSDTQRQRSFRNTPAYSSGARLGISTWFGARFDGLNLQLTPEQRAVTQETEITQPVVAPGQFSFIQQKWHVAFDRQSKPYSLGYATPLVLLPIYWIVTAWRRRDQRKPNHCRQCGYNLTGNISGVCPECGNGVIGSAEHLCSR